MRCDDINELMSEQIDGRLDREGQKLLSEHLAQCDRCRADFSALKDAVKIVHGVGLESPPSDLLARVRAEIDDGDNRAGSFFETAKEKASPGDWSLFNSPQSRMALAASLLLAVGIYGFITGFERKNQDGAISMSDAGATVPTEPNVAPSVIPAPSASTLDDGVAAMAKARKSELSVSGKAAKGMPMEEKSGWSSTTRDVLPVQKQVEKKDMDKETELARIPAAKHSAEIQNVHSRSIVLNQPAVINQQNQSSVTSISREQGMPVLAESAADSQVGSIQTQSRQVQQVSNSWLNQQQLNAPDIQGQVMELSIVTDDVEGVLSLIRDQLSSAAGKDSKPVSRLDGQNAFRATAESSGKTVVNMEMVFAEHQAFVEKLKAKGDVTVGTGVCVEAARSKSASDKAAGSHVKVRVNIIRRK
ncbi:MAG: hypothetical protein A2283_12120 [Lentisphaerae bacterium RIFOXYA12_FULL_48_11]|nr:MAG: hypothetical protein A2283_12120 [Lentisphaerae bacterium RIFOXYA12_FULL_48_11]